jgi:hypothetical protein
MLACLAYTNNKMNNSHGGVILMGTPDSDPVCGLAADADCPPGSTCEPVAIVPASCNGTTVLWFDGAGKQHLFDSEGNPTPAVKKLLDAQRAVISADIFQTGEFLENPSQPPAAQKVNEAFAGYTFGYNRPLLSNRVRDILTVIAGVRKFPAFTRIELVGTGDAGPWVALARGLAGNQVGRCIADLRGFGFSKIRAMSDPMLLPGALKYGGIGGLLALAVPSELLLFGTEGVPSEELIGLTAVNQAAQGKLTQIANPLTDDAAVEQLLK